MKDIAIILIISFVIGLNPDGVFASQQNTADNVTVVTSIPI
jgi:hypothetical protein